ncbi:hypothetical protein CEXT_531181 [Caerostris extrusa]|uniref:Uncharacterized protein n=1 Tax=Caerostris extrusa TaxID=172846 RepID=A0AAV4XHI4_CAEEX|nr:hypothetical protein CEXT_531181 [Caerostris extrusa]
MVALNFAGPNGLSPQARPADLHAIPNPGTREGIPLQPLPDSPEAIRDRSRPLPHRAPDQDLVPEPEDEAQEGDEGRQGDQRAGRIESSKVKEEDKDKNGVDKREDRKNDHPIITSPTSLILEDKIRNPPKPNPTADMDGWQELVIHPSYFLP